MTHSLVLPCFLADKEPDQLTLPEDMSSPNRKIYLSWCKLSENISKCKTNVEENVNNSDWNLLQKSSFHTPVGHTVVRTEKLKQEIKETKNLLGQKCSTFK